MVVTSGLLLTAVKEQNEPALQFHVGQIACMNLCLRCHVTLCLQAYDRPNSAYMLFYERSDSLEPVTMMEEIAAAAPQEAASLATGVPVSAVPSTAPAVETEARLQQPGTAKLPVLEPAKL